MTAFQNLPQARQQQLIIETIHAFIQEERRINYHFLGNHSHRYMSQKDLLNVSVEHGLYTFTECHQQRSKRTAFIEASPSSYTLLTTDDLIITPCDAITLFAPTTVNKWMRDTYTWDNTWELRDPEEQYEEQRRWWDRNGKTFPLLTLPREMRDAIYLQILGHVIIPKHYKGNVVLGLGLKQQTPREGTRRDPDVHRPNMRIMQVCTQVKREATEVVTRDATKRFRLLSSAVPVLCHFLQFVDISTRAGFLRVMQLEMSAKKFFAFIGITPLPLAPLHRDLGPRGVDYLKHIPSLQKLDFRFIGPKHKDAACPWNFFAQANSIHSCQKLWIHWFFILAWDALHELLATKQVKISLSGCVKTSSRNYWQDIFDDSKRTDYTPMIKALERQIRRTNIVGPIPCRCSSLCGRDERFGVVEWSEHEMRHIVGLREECERWYWDFDD